MSVYVVTVLSMSVCPHHYEPRLPGDDPGVLPAPGPQTLGVARRHMAQDVNLLPGSLRLQQPVNQPDQHVA